MKACKCKAKPVFYGCRPGRGRSTHCEDHNLARNHRKLLKEDCLKLQENISKLIGFPQTQKPVFTPSQPQRHFRKPSHKVPPKKMHGNWYKFIVRYKVSIEERMNATEFLHYPHLCKRESQKSRWRQTGLVPCGVRTSDWWIKALRAGIVTKQDPRQPRCNHVFMQLRAPGKAPARNQWMVKVDMVPFLKVFTNCFTVLATPYHNIKF